MSSARLELFGSPVIRRDGAPVSGRAAYRRRLALLAVLAAARGRPVARDRLLGLLWPERSEASARHTLSESLYVLRKELGEGAVVAVGGEVALDPERAPSDLEAFELALDEDRPEDAATLYRAPFLDGFYVAGAPEFERWAQAERDRLARAFAAAVESVAERAEGAGEWTAAAGWWRRLADADPYSSRVALRLIDALSRGGDGAAALRHAEAHDAFLRAELGMGADGEVAAAVRRLHQAAAPLPPRPAPGVPPGGPMRRRPPLRRPSAASRGRGGGRRRPAVRRWRSWRASSPPAPPPPPRTRLPSTRTASPSSTSTTTARAASWATWRTG